MSSGLLMISSNSVREVFRRTYSSLSTSWRGASWFMRWMMYWRTFSWRAERRDSPVRPNNRLHRDWRSVMDLAPSSRLPSLLRTGVRRPQQDPRPLWWESYHVDAVSPQKRVAGGGLARDPPVPANVVHDELLRVGSCGGPVASVVGELVEAEHGLHRVGRRLPDGLDVLAVDGERHTFRRPLRRVDVEVHLHDRPTPMAPQANLLEEEVCSEA